MYLLEVKEVEEVTKLTGTIPILGDDDTLVGCLELTEVEGVIELVGTVPVLDDNETMVDWLELGVGKEERRLV